MIVDLVERVNLKELYLYFDPVTSFINILHGSNEAKTVDGRRIYRLKKNEGENGNIILKIEDYINIWADHKKNDLEYIEIFCERNSMHLERCWLS